MAHRIVMAFTCLIALATAAPAYANETETIRTHLLQVEAHLRSVDVSGWTTERQEARKARLDDLHDYAMAGEFPKNTRHPGGETPYFIDDHGTACAVGHLMIESGHKDAALAIAERENNAYVMEMRSPELEPWVKSSGLTAEEAAWIQPAYGFICDELDPIEVAITAPDTVECGQEFDLTATRPPQTQCAHTYAWSIEGDATPQAAQLGFDGEERVVGEFQEWNDVFIGGYDIVARFPENVFDGAYTVTLEVTRENGDSASTTHELQLNCMPDENPNSDPNSDPGQPNVPDGNDEPFEEESACSSAAGSGFPTGLLIVLMFIAIRHLKKRENQ